MIAIGLTGSIGMGKSGTAMMFAEAGVPIWDADAAVHRLYAEGGDGVEPVLKRFPQAGSIKTGIDRAILSGTVVNDPPALADLEAIVHPLVRQDQMDFIQGAEEQGAPMVLLDIPLLVEGGMIGLFQEIVVVTADLDVRRKRVLERPEMTEDKLDAILARQASEEDRLAIATHVIRTDQGFETARDRVQEVIAAIREKHGLPGEPEQS